MSVCKRNRGERMGIKIAGLGKAVPQMVLDNEKLSERVDTSHEWIKSRTGIEKRCIAVTETTEQLATSAALEAILAANIEASQLDLVIVATVSPDTTMPSTACLVARNIGANRATCFDITAACSGFVFASEVAVSMMAQGGYQNALVIGAEVLSKVVDWEDRSTCILFADGAGAAVYMKDEKNQILAIETGSNPKEADQITLPTGIGNHVFYQVEERKQVIQMVGRAVYVFATTEVPESIRRVLEKVQLTPEEIDHYILHQANSRIMDHVAQRLGVAKERFFKNLSQYGNTSAASIPMALYDAKALLKPGDYIILSGFGAGLTWGTMLLKW